MGWAQDLQARLMPQQNQGGLLAQLSNQQGPIYAGGLPVYNQLSPEDLQKALAQQTTLADNFGKGAIPAPLVFAEDGDYWKYSSDGKGGWQKTNLTPEMKRGDALKSFVTNMASIYLPVTGIPGISTGFAGASNAALGAGMGGAASTGMGAATGSDIFDYMGGASSDAGIGTGAAVAGADAAGGFSANELQNLGLTLEDFAPGGDFAGVPGGGLAPGYGSSTIQDLLDQGVPYSQALDAMNPTSSGTFGDLAQTGGTDITAANVTPVDLANLGLTTEDFAPGGLAGGITGAAAPAAVPQPTYTYPEPAQVPTGTPLETLPSPESITQPPGGGVSPLPKPWTTPQNLIGAGTLGLSALATGAAIAGSGDQTTAATTTTTPTGPGTNPMPGMDNTTAGKKTFEDYINDFYGLSGQPSVQQRTAQDQTALTGYQQALLDKLGALDTSHLAETKAAVQPYQSQLGDVLNQSQTGTGYFKPVNLSFGGNPIASFVPRQNTALANQSLGMGKEASSINTALADIGYGQGTNLAGREYGFQSENLPNKAADTYSAKLGALMQYLNPNTGQTSTTTGTVPGVPWYTAALQGANTMTNIFDKIYDPRQADTNALLGALLAKGGTP